MDYLERVDLRIGDRVFFTIAEADGVGGAVNVKVQGLLVAVEEGRYAIVAYPVLSLYRQAGGEARVVSLSHRPVPLSDLTKG